MSEQPIDETVEPVEVVEETPKPKKSTKPKMIARLTSTERARAIVRARLK